mgnify:CR=1 FL=1
MAVAADLIYLLDGVREYCEGLGVEIRRKADEKRPGYAHLIVRAYNEAGYNFTEVDLLELLSWIKKNMPNMWSAL